MKVLLPQYCCYLFVGKQKCELIWKENVFYGIRRSSFSIKSDEKNDKIADKCKNVIFSLFRQNNLFFSGRLKFTKDLIWKKISSQEVVPQTQILFCFHEDLNENRSIFWFVK